MLQPVVDYETKPIIAGSGLAPAPVGVAILSDSDPVYLRWGHPSGNNCSFDDARRALLRVWAHRPIFHNAKFDIGVALEHMDLPWPQNGFDDTMILAYLAEPLATSLGLKQLAARHLGMDPEERDAVFAWLKANFKGPFLPDHKMITPNNAGAYISYAPGDIVDPYACGDVVRTRGMFNALLPKVEGAGMREAYERELTVVYGGYYMERVGVCVNREALERDAVKYKALQDKQEEVIRSHLGDIDLDERGSLGAALIAGGHLHGELPKTPTGKVSTAKGALQANVADPALLQALRHRGALHTVNNTFFRGWLNFSARDGRLHPSWNQVRQPSIAGAKKVKGARTGRFSCDAPNLTNVATEFDEDTLEGLDMPFMRQYIVPEEGHILVPADYNGQEMRILAHYSEGRMADEYQKDPKADMHTVASRLILEATGMLVTRKKTKAVGFSLIYGSGVALLAKQLGVDEETAFKIKEAYFAAFPGLKEFLRLFRDRNDIRTWGGRVLPCEPPGIYEGKYRTWGYKLPNYLIQGSAADQTKQALIRYIENREWGYPLLVVHDELVISVPIERARTEIPILRHAMEGMSGWDVPFAVDVETGHDWHNLTIWSEQ
jgi:DNA polymerase-1